MILQSELRKGLAVLNYDAAGSISSEAIFCCILFETKMARNASQSDVLDEYSPYFDFVPF